MLLEDIILIFGEHLDLLIKLLDWVKTSFVSRKVHEEQKVPEEDRQALKKFTRINVFSRLLECYLV